MDRRLDNAGFWHRGDRTKCLGCFLCPDKRTCGGLGIDNPVFNCMDFCKCNGQKNCNLVCPGNPTNFVARMREVRGWSFDDICPAPSVIINEIPSLVPIMPHGYCRSRPLNSRAVAIPLDKLFRPKSGGSRFASKKDLAKKFNYSDSAQLIVSGVGYDQHLENYWGPARAAGFPQQLAALKPDLITTPNFSLFSNVPRWDNLHNMKRIAICWQELAALGLPTALHVNGRTDQDFLRWSDFIKAHPEIEALSFEFATGAASPVRALWYRDRFIELAQRVGRPLLLVMRGGAPLMRDLLRYYRSITFLSHIPIIKALNRRRLLWTPGRNPRWTLCDSQNGEEMDMLVKQNLEAFGAMLEDLRNPHVN
jgi:hypothetical protein